jgi:hypothetical protein
MKILYGVPGEGMGHATRTKVIVTHLLEKGHDVKIVSSDKAFGFLRQAFPGRVYEIEGLHFAFKKGKIVPVDLTDPTQVASIWTKVIKVVGDGTNAGRGALTNGLGPILFSDVIPTGAVAERIVPRFINDLDIALETEIVNQAFANLNFGLRYSAVESQWKIITASNLNLTEDFSLGKSGDTTSTNVDSSWIVAFVKQADSYTVRIRTLSYVFGSVNQNRFYFDSNEKRYNDQLGAVVKDQIRVLGVNTASDLINELRQDIEFEISDSIKFDDGYESTNEIKLGFRDADDDGVIDNPDSFENLVGIDQDLNFLFFEEITDVYGTKIFNLLDNSNDLVLVREKESLINFNDTATYPDQQLIYFYDQAEDIVKKINRLN